jgi:hypothetical protein
MIIEDYSETEDGAEGTVTLDVFGGAELLAQGKCDRAYVEACCRAAEQMQPTLLGELAAATKRSLGARKGGRLRASNHRTWPWRRKPKGDATAADAALVEAVLADLELLSISVWEPRGDAAAFSLEFTCDSAAEEGVEWAVRDGAAVYVGPVQGVDPWDDLTDDPMNMLAAG